MKKIFTLISATMALFSAVAQTVAPEGPVQYYSRTGSFYEYDWDGFATGNQSGCIGVVVDGSDVYFQNLVMSINNNTWVKGTLGDDGKTVTIPADNVLMQTSTWLELPDGNWGEFFGVIRVAMLNYSVVDDVPNFTPATDIPIQLSIEDNTITLLNTAAEQTVLGTIYDGFEAEGMNGKWNMGADFNTVFTLFDEPIVTVPADAEGVDYLLKYHGAYSDEPSFEYVSLYTVGDDVYVKGFYSGDKQMTFKGTRQGDKLHFDSNQLVGIYSGYIMEMVAANYTKSEPDEWGWCDVTIEDAEGIDFAIDETTGTYSLAQGEAIRLTVRDHYDSNFNMYCDLSLCPYVEKLLTPSEPTIIDVTDYYDMEGDWCVYFECPLYSVDNEPLNVENLYFCFYINDELYTFDAERYRLDADLVDVPYTMTGNAFINCQTYFGIMNYIQEKEIRKVGVQLIYRLGDEESRSTINEYIVSEDAIHTLKAESQNGSIHNLQGQRLNQGQKGLQVRDGKVVWVK